jgi:hypothetical protein
MSTTKRPRPETDQHANSQRTKASNNDQCNQATPESSNATGKQAMGVIKNERNQTSGVGAKQIHDREPVLEPTTTLVWLRVYFEGVKNLDAPILTSKVTYSTEYLLDIISCRCCLSVGPSGLLLSTLLGCVLEAGRWLPRSWDGSNRLSHQTIKEV